MKMKQHGDKVKPADDSAPVATPDDTAQVAKKNITCSYGIHRGNFPIAGLKVKDARAILKKLIKVDDSAAAVINGANVSEDEIIQEGTTLLSFVKPSAKKGVSETIEITGKSVKLDSKTIPVDRFCGLVSQNTIGGLHDEPIPDNVKWAVRASFATIYIVELKPELRNIKWLADNSKVPYGEGATYTNRKLATPYVVLKVPIITGGCGVGISPHVELFYRNKPLQTLDDPLYHSNLYNVSPMSYGARSWFCTQYLDTSKCKGHTDILDEVISHVWGGGFNKSSDRNEGTSGLQITKKHVDDERVCEVNKWEKASEKDPRFVLDVKWHKADTTPRDRIESDLKQLGITAVPNTSSALGNIMLQAR